MTRLFDGNLLVALAIDTHIHHDVSLKWFASTRPAFATCAVTEGTLLRLAMHQGLSSDAAWALLGAIRGITGHEFWDEGFSYAAVSPERIQGHRQITDAWLAELCRRRQAKLATLDSGLALLHKDVAELIR